MKIHRSVDYIKVMLKLGIVAMFFMVGLMIGYSLVQPCRYTTAFPECMEYVTYEEKDGVVVETKLPERNKGCDAQGTNRR